MIISREQLEALTNTELRDIWDGYLNWTAISTSFGGRLRNESELPELCKSYNRIWKTISFGLGGPKNWTPYHLPSDAAKLVAHRLPDMPRNALGGEISEVVGIWTKALADYGLRLFWDYDIPIPVATGLECARLSEVARLIGIDEQVRELYKGYKNDAKTRDGRYDSI